MRRRVRRSILTLAATAGGWEMTRNVQAFLTAAAGTAAGRGAGRGAGDSTDDMVVVSAILAEGQVKGTDGPDWVLACVLLDVRAWILAQARTSTSARRNQFRKHESLIPKSFAITEIGASPLRATATTSSRNSLGWGFGMVNTRPAGPHGPTHWMSPIRAAVPLFHRSHQIGDQGSAAPSPPGPPQMLRIRAQPRGQGMQLPLEINDCSRRFGTEGVDPRTEHESKGWICLTSSYR